MENSLSASDVLALTNDRDGMAGAWNNPFIYLVWLALLGGGNFFGGGWGGNNGAAAAVYDNGAMTRNAIYEGNINQDIFRNMGEISTELGTVNSTIIEQTGNLRYDLAQQASNAQLATSQGFCGVNYNIADLKADGFKNTCEITTAIHQEAEITRGLIEQNTIQNLRDRLEEKDRELLSAQFQYSQQAQNATLINALRPYPQPAYITSSPYQSIYGNYGYTYGYGYQTPYTV